MTFVQPTRLAQALAVVGGLAGMAAGEAAAAEANTTLPVVTVTGASSSYAAPASATANRTDTPNLQTAQSVQVVPRAVIDDQKALTLSEAVRNVSGVQFDFSFNGALQPQLILRGFPSTSMTALGPLSGSSGYYLDGTRVTGVPINMANVESVEVIKGPASVLYGRAEPGGLVNVVSKTASSVPHFSFEQTVGQRDLFRSSLEASGPLNADRTLRGRFAASNYSAGSVRDDVKDKLGALTGSLAWVPSARTSVTATLDYTHQRYRTDYGIPAIGNRPGDLPWSRQFNDSPDLSYAKTTNLRLEAQHQIDDIWQIKARAIRLRSRLSEKDILPYRYNLGMAFSPAQMCPGTGDPLCRYYFGRPDGQAEINQFNTDLIGKFNTGGIGHTVLLGIDTYSSRKTGTTYFEQIAAAPLDGSTLGATPGLNPALAIPVQIQERSRWTSFYVQDQLSLGHGVFLTGALRHDDTSAIYAGAGASPNQQSFTTPRLGVVWQFAATQSVYAQYQDAVAANSGRDTVTLAPLQAERARQFEVGHKVELFDGRLNSTVALYQLVKRHRGATVPIDVSPYYNIVAIGQARSRGLEWDVSGALTSRLSLIASYAYTDAEVTRDPLYQGKRLANVARHTASLWARYAIDQQWTAGGGIFAQGQRQGDVGNTFQLPGYGRLDAMLAYRFALGAGKAALQFNLDNVLNKKYYSGSYQFVSDWIRPGTPRTAKVTLRAEY